jgi:hypothetical protein
VALREFHSLNSPIRGNRQESKFDHMLKISKAWLAGRLGDPLRRSLAAELLIEVSPLVIKDYALPPYLSYRRTNPLWKAIRNNLVHPWLVTRAPLLLPGEWDLAARPFSETRHYKFLRDLHTSNFNYKCTSYYLRLLNELHAGKIIY